MNIRFELPRVVTLPRAEIVCHSELRIALADPSKQLLRVWRLERGFPPSYRDGNSSFCVTSEIEKWLARQGIDVRRV